MFLSTADSSPAAYPPARDLLSGVEIVDDDDDAFYYGGSFFFFPSSLPPPPPPRGGASPTGSNSVRTFVRNTEEENDERFPVRRQSEIETDSANLSTSRFHENVRKYRG